MSNGKTFKITYLSVLFTTPKQLGEACRKVEDELGVKIDFVGFTKEECEEDPLRYDELCRRTMHCDIVYIRCMGDPWKFKKFDRYTDVLKRTDAFVAPVSGNIDVDMMTSDLFSGTDEDLKEMARYNLCKSPENDFLFIWWLCWHFGLTDRKPGEPVMYPDHYLYAKGKECSDVRKALDSLDPERITVGIMLANGQMSYGDDEFLDVLIQKLESMGMQSIAAVCSFDAMRRPGGTEEVFRTYFNKNGRPIIDVMISLTGYANTNRADGNIPNIDEESCFRRLVDVPIIFGMSYHCAFLDFELEKVGMKKTDFTSNIIYPELDGDIMGVPITYSTKENPKKSIPIHERMDHLCRMAKAWGSLRRKPVSERRVAVMMWQSRPNSGMIGAAAGLDTVESVSDILKRLDSLGYKVKNCPADGRELIEEILDNVTNDLDNQSIQSVREKAVDLVSKKDYEKDYMQIPEWDRRMTEEKWGEPVGEIMTDSGKIVIPGLMKGNVFVCYQPLRGWADQQDQNTHDPLLFTQHQYNAYYWWIKNVFKADMIYHMGTHGTLEWLPGLNVGLSEKCDPDYVLDAIPNIYPYTINDPGEGVQAKRRSESVLIGHMPPAMARGDIHGNLNEVEVQMQDYFRLRGTAPEPTVKGIVNQIYEAVKANNLLKDLGLDGENDPGPEGFADHIIELHRYMEEVEEALIRADMHIIGRVPKDHHFDEMVYSLTRLDNGDVRSLRDAFAENIGVDIQKAIEDPSGIGADGRLNSEIVRDVDADEQDFITRIRTEFDCDVSKSLDYLNERFGHVSDDLRRSVEYTCGFIIPNVRRMSYELDHMMEGTDGRFVIPGPSGSPIRGNADILPMGRNFYSLDPECVPTKTSWEIGKRMADQMIERYVEDKGTYPREIGIVIWATDMMTTGGDDASYVLWLLGLRPVWSKIGGKVTDLEIVPVKELGRPRVDVTINITGLFRDTFPATIDLLDDAIKMVAELDESDEDNALAANLRQDIAEDILSGMSRDEARERNSVRIFGEALGTYGNGVGNLIESGKWDETKDLADIYADLSSFGYVKGNYGRPMKREFMRRFGKVTATIKNAPSREFDILDIDDVYQYLGGMNAFVRTYGQKDAVTYMGDNSDPSKTKIRSTQEELRFLFRSKVTNPKFNSGLMEHGYRGASEMAKITEYTMAWGATSDIAEDWMYEALTDTYLRDKDVHEWMNDVNPYAVMNILNTLFEAIRRGLWDATEEYQEFLKEMYMEAEERIEEITDK
ncbi:cobaltochelatase CobN [methanogenic archaeon mixed culture ISO4-G1]|nr:cobaltochelatase CobN [methanogenic archaeon mixed culture ISO4-G1]